jgi:hypothetical protein
MTKQIRTLARITATLAALAIIVPAAHAGHTQPLKRGLADFRVAAQQPAQHRPPATPMRGCTDFGLVFDYKNGCVTPRTAQTQPATSSFHWHDAGIGAGATLGIVLLLAGLGSAILPRAQHRHVTNA